MKNIVLTRIDDRLIHGQFVTSWLKYVKCDAVLIIDDNLAKDEFMKRIYKASCPSDVELFVYDFNDAYKFLNESSDTCKDVIILSKAPENLEKLIENGMNIKEIILGAMSSEEGRKKVIKNVYASDKEISSMIRIIRKNVKVLYKLVYRDKEVDVENILKGMSNL